MKLIPTGNSYGLKQPVLSTEPEPGHATNDVLSFDTFIDLLRDEEEYFTEDKFQTKQTITRLRKIFYDKFGWDTNLIRRAAHIEGRYQVEIIDCDSLSEMQAFKRINFYVDNVEQPKCRRVTYKSTDRVFGSRRVGIAPEIYRDDHADVCLPEGYHCDLGHTLAGLDALNNLQFVSPLPNWLLFLYRCFVFVDSNADVTTWLGDIATSGAAFLFNYLRTNRPNTPDEEQAYINNNASASDMLGNIDAFVIHNLYKDAEPNRRVTSLLVDYYHGTLLRKDKIALFCKYVGLREWDGKRFINETEWLNYYTDQLRNTTAFMVFSSTGNTIQKFTLPYRVWKGKYDEIIKPPLLLTLFLDELKTILT